jgi:hypothetical protein
MLDERVSQNVIANSGTFFLCPIHLVEQPRWHHLEHILYALFIFTCRRWTTAEQFIQLEMCKGWLMFLSLSFNAITVSHRGP